MPGEKGSPQHSQDDNKGAVQSKGANSEPKPELKALG